MVPILFAWMAMAVTWEVLGRSPHGPAERPGTTMWKQMRTGTFMFQISWATPFKSFRCLSRMHVLPLNSLAYTAVKLPSSTAQANPGVQECDAFEAPACIAAGSTIFTSLYLPQIGRAS